MEGIYTNCGNMSAVLNGSGFECTFMELGYQWSIERIAATSLLDTDECKRNTLAFKSEDDLFDFIRAHGLGEYMIERHYESIRNTDNLLVWYTSPIPLGCPFLLQYVLRPNRSGGRL